ncbi:WD domain-containing protein [Stagonosporopsis vannaccii]|nr:WD domain-containing protein [Stagonosporopsis vannaccii]
MTDHRRISATASPAIPPAPPPPPPKIKSRSYFERFVAQPLQSAAYASRPPSVQAHRPDGGPLNPLVPKLLGIRTGHSLDATHKTGLDIAALDINRERTHAVLAGKEILKTVRVDGTKIVDETNLRAAVLTYADSHARQRDGLGIQDVKWSHGQFSSHIATAVANGKVILYDLNRASVELVRLHEHTRQVHKLAFNPHQGHLLLSASHDATVRLWDLRDLRRDAACTSRDQFSGVSGGIRDVQWSPTDAMEFAFGTDNGTIQRWDFRHNKVPKQKIPAHDQKTCTSIDWHPDGKHLLSAGVDRTVKVWDFSIDGRRQKATYVLTTPYPVHRARWRPPYWSDEFHDKGAFQCTQVATSYDRDHPVIHVWDFRRPHLPYREISRYRSPPSDMLWQTRDTLWTVGREGIFQQNDVHHAPKTTERRPLQAIAVSPNGEVSGVTQKRSRGRRSPGLSYDDMYLGAPPDKHGSVDKNSARGSADNSFDESFLSSSAMKRHHGRTASNRSAKSFSSTPPSDVTPKVMYLPDSMHTQSEQFQPNQLGFRGVLPGAINVQVFAYLAQKYKAQSLPDRPVLESYLELEHPFQQNAEYAQRAAYHRLAQTWTLVGATMANATRRRAELHRELRLKDKKTKFEDPKNTSGQLHVHDKPWIAPQNPAVRAILGNLDRPRPASPLTKATTPIESTSNLATPLARPVNASMTASSEPGRLELPDPDRDEKIDLPPSVLGVPKTSIGRDGVPPNQVKPNGGHWYDSPEGLEERRAAAGSWRASPRIPLNLNPAPVRTNNPIVPPPLERHDSGESFTMFSASTDSQRGSSVSGSFESVDASLHSMEELSTGWQHAPGKSSFGRPTNTSSIGQEPDLSPTTKGASDRLPIPIVSQPQHGSLMASKDDTGHLMPPNSADRVTQDMDALRRTNQLMRHDSSESSAYASSHEGTSFSSTYEADMEASGTIIPDADESQKSPPALNAYATPPVIVKAVPYSAVPTKDTQLLLSDFEALQVDSESMSAFTVVDLLRSILEFHTDTLSDAQFPSLLLLLLTPLLPQTHSPSESSDIDVDEVLSAFSDTFIALGLTPTQAKAILSKQLAELICTGINPYQAESILHTYHAQMHSLSLFNSAASLRRLAYPTYPSVYEQALKDTQLGLLCLSCKSPINNPKDKMRCESCKRAQAPCPICWAKYPAFEPISAKRKSKSKQRDEKGHKRRGSSLVVTSAIPNRTDDGVSPSVPESWMPTPATLWTWCPLCGHGGHTNCLSSWFANATLSDGACPTEGCLCDCVSGRRREEKMQELRNKKAEKERSKTVKKGNDWKVRESKAVSAIRGTFGENNSQPPSPTSQQRSRTPIGSRKGDDKKVRVLTPNFGAGAQMAPST